MKVFISWSGPRSHALAEALHDWLPLVLHYVEPWLSQADIAAGQRWADQVARELEASNFGIVCVTRDNVSSPWVLFEAGALAKSMQDSRVIPLLLDLEIRDIAGPLAQFQATKTDKDGVSGIVASINQLATHRVPAERVRQLFEALWPDLEKKISALPSSTAPAKHARPQPEILEELVASVRSLDSRVRAIGDGPRRSSFRKRLHPMMAIELGQMIRERPGDPIAILIVASMFRDEFPWLYEMGMEAYRASKSGTRDEAVEARRRFARAAGLVRRGPFPVEYDSRMLHRMMRELDHMLDETNSNDSVSEVAPSSGDRNDPSESQD